MKLTIITKTHFGFSLVEIVEKLLTEKKKKKKIEYNWFLSPFSYQKKALPMNSWYNYLSLQDWSKNL